MWLLVCLVLAELVVGCNGDRKELKTEIERGKALFIRNGCTVCHGESGWGDGKIATSLRPPPRDFRERGSYKNGSDQASIARTIEKGVPGTSMPGYPHLVTADRRLIAVYIYSLQK